MTKERTKYKKVFLRLKSFKNEKEKLKFFSELGRQLVATGSTIVRRKPSDFARKNLKYEIVPKRWRAMYSYEVTTEFSAQFLKVQIEILFRWINNVNEKYGEKRINLNEKVLFLLFKAYSFNKYFSLNLMTKVYNQMIANGELVTTDGILYHSPVVFLKFHESPDKEVEKGANNKVTIESSHLGKCHLEILKNSQVIQSSEEIEIFAGQEKLLTYSLTNCGIYDLKIKGILKKATGEKRVDGIQKILFTEEVVESNTVRITCIHQPPQVEHKSLLVDFINHKTNIKTGKIILNPPYSFHFSEDQHIFEEINDERVTLTNDGIFHLNLSGIIRFKIGYIFVRFKEKEFWSKPAKIELIPIKIKYPNTIKHGDKCNIQVDLAREKKIKYTLYSKNGRSITEKLSRKSFLIKTNIEDDSDLPESLTIEILDKPTYKTTFTLNLNIPKPEFIFELETGSVTDPIKLLFQNLPSLEFHDFLEIIDPENKILPFKVNRNEITVTPTVNGHYKLRCNSEEIILKGKTEFYIRKTPILSINYEHNEIKLELTFDSNLKIQSISGQVTFNKFFEKELKDISFELKNADLFETALKDTIPGLYEISIDLIYDDKTRDQLNSVFNVNGLITKYRNKIDYFTLLPKELVIDFSDLRKEDSLYIQFRNISVNPDTLTLESESGGDSLKIKKIMIDDDQKGGILKLIMPYSQLSLGKHHIKSFKVSILSIIIKGVKIEGDLLEFYQLGDEISFQITLFPFNEEKLVFNGMKIIDLVPDPITNKINVNARIIDRGPFIKYESYGIADLNIQVVSSLEFEKSLNDDLGTEITIHTRIRSDETILLESDPNNLLDPNLTQYKVIFDDIVEASNSFTVTDINQIDIIGMIKNRDTLIKLKPFTIDIPYFLTFSSLPLQEYKVYDTVEFDISTNIPLEVKDLGVYLIGKKDQYEIKPTTKKVNNKLFRSFFTLKTIGDLTLVITCEYKEEEYTCTHNFVVKDDFKFVPFEKRTFYVNEPIEAKFTTSRKPVVFLLNKNNDIRKELNYTSESSKYHYKTEFRINHTGKYHLKSINTVSQSFKVIPFLKIHCKSIQDQKNQVYDWKEEHDLILEFDDSIGVDDLLICINKNKRSEKITLFKYRFNELPLAEIDSSRGGINKYKLSTPTLFQALSSSESDQYYIVLKSPEHSAFFQFLKLPFIQLDPIDELILTPESAITITGTSEDDVELFLRFEPCVNPFYFSFFRDYTPKTSRILDDNGKITQKIAISNLIPGFSYKVYYNAKKRNFTLNDNFLGKIHVIKSRIIKNSWKNTSDLTLFIPSNLNLSINDVKIDRIHSIPFMKAHISSKNEKICVSDQNTHFPLNVDLLDGTYQYQKYKLAYSSSTYNEISRGDLKAFFKKITFNQTTAFFILDGQEIYQPLVSEFLKYLSNNPIRVAFIPYPSPLDSKVIEKLETARKVFEKQKFNPQTRLSCPHCLSNNSFSIYKSSSNHYGGFCRKSGVYIDSFGNIVKIKDVSLAVSKDKFIPVATKVFLECPACESPLFITTQELKLEPSHSLICIHCDLEIPNIAISLGELNVESPDVSFLSHKMMNWLLEEKSIINSIIGAAWFCSNCDKFFPYSGILNKIESKIIDEILVFIENNINDDLDEIEEKIHDLEKQSQITKQKNKFRRKLIDKENEFKEILENFSDFIFENCFVSPHDLSLNLLQRLKKENSVQDKISTTTDIFDTKISFYTRWIIFLKQLFFRLFKMNKKTISDNTSEETIVEEQNRLLESIHIWNNCEILLDSFDSIHEIISSIIDLFDQHFKTRNLEATTSQEILQIFEQLRKILVFTEEEKQLVSSSIKAKKSRKYIVSRRRQKITSFIIQQSINDEIETWSEGIMGKKEASNVLKLVQSLGLIDFYFNITNKGMKFLSNPDLTPKPCRCGGLFTNRTVEPKYLFLESKILSKGSGRRMMRDLQSRLKNTQIFIIES